MAQRPDRLALNTPNISSIRVNSAKKKFDTVPENMEIGVSLLANNRVYTKAYECSNIHIKASLRYR